MFDKVAYVEHPVSSKDKKELNSKGYRLVDVRFKPESIEKGDKVIMKQEDAPKPEANPEAEK